MSKRRKTMTYFLKEDYEIYASLPCSAVVFSVDDDYKIYSPMTHTTTEILTKIIL